MHQLPPQARVSPLKTVLNYYHLVLAGSRDDCQQAATILAEHCWPYGDDDDRELLDRARLALGQICSVWADQLGIDILPTEPAKDTYLYLRLRVAISTRTPIPERLLRQAEHRGMHQSYAQGLLDAVKLAGLAPEDIEKLVNARQ